MRPTDRAGFRSFAFLLAAVTAGSCKDVSNIVAKRPPNGALAAVRFEPVFSASARNAAVRLEDFGIGFDRVRIVIVRPAADTLRDTTITFAPGQADVTLDLRVEARSDGEILRAGLDYANASGVVFHGEGNVIARAIDSPSSPQQITVQYAGPGFDVRRIEVSPKTPSIVAPDGVRFTVTAFDSNNGVVSSVPVSWTSSDPTVATISTAGVLSTTGKRGTVTVTARTPTDASDVATVSIRLGTSGIVVVSGGGQSGKVGATLGQLAVVRVVASDGIGVANASVSFAPPSGGRVGATTAVTDANGTASVALTLGGTIGTQSFTAVTGAFNVAINAIATVGDAASIAVVSGAGQVDTVRRQLSLPLVVKVVDRFENPVPDVVVTWARGIKAGALNAETSTTNADGIATNRYTLGALAGGDTVVASVSGVSGSARFPTVGVPGAPAPIVAASGDAQTGRILQPLAPFVIRVIDESGNPLSGATVNWTAVNGTLTPTTRTDADGTTSNTMTLGSATGSASATATVASRSIRFTATVQSGVVSKLAFLTQPPTSHYPGATIPSVRVALQDAGGNQTPATNAVTIALAPNQYQGTLHGTLTRAAVAGVATFDDLTIDQLGSGYRLIASSAGVAALTSNAFALTSHLIDITPPNLDALFATVPFTLTGSGFVPGSTTVVVTGGQITVSNVSVQSSTTISGYFNIPGGAATSAEQISVSTILGASNTLPLGVHAVGMAPPVNGTAQGGGGGTAFALDCPTGAVGTGLNVRGGANVDQVQLVCQTITGTARTFGTATFTAAAGGSGGSLYTLMCPTDQILVGLTGRIGNGGSGLNDMIGGVCAPVSGSGQGSYTQTVGSNFGGSVAYTSLCAPGLAVAGLRGGAGNLVDRTQIVCR